MESQSNKRSTNTTVPLNRRSFPSDFVFGTASSAYQFEGAAKEGGRGPSIWDTFTQRHPGKIKDGTNGNMAVDSYHRYKEDVKILKKIGLDAYRFSISWSRILPTGSLSGGVNQKGIDYYNNLIDELLANGITPFVTLFHWDLPQALEDEYGGFLSGRIVSDFCNYAELCFWEFGDRVKHWITLNEPWSYSVGGYVKGFLAPGHGSSSPEPIRSLHSLCRSSFHEQQSSSKGDQGREPYIVSHNQLLAHANAVHLYRDKFKAIQEGIIGISLVSSWFEPLHDNEDDKAAADRALDFMLGWFLKPLTSGCYPSTMKSNVGDRLDDFDDEEKEYIRGTFDFIGLNYYTANYATKSRQPIGVKLSYTTDSLVKLTPEKNGVLIGPKAASDWLYIYPEGIYELLNYIKENYGNPTIYITENGVDEENDPKLTLLEARVDKIRKDYYDMHLRFVRDAIYDGANVIGYFAWSFLDNFEWSEGYTVRFGMIHVDYNNGLSRYPKDSAIWFMNLLKQDSQKSLKDNGPSQKDNGPNDDYVNDFDI